VPFDRAIDHVVLQVGDARDGNRHLDAIVQSRDPPAIGPASAAAGDPHSRAVDFGARLQVVERPDAVPGFDARRGVAAAEPPPAIVAVRAVMNAFDFAKLQGIDHQADIAVPREPGPVVLVMRLPTEVDAVFRHAGVAADVENGRERAWALLRHEQVAGDVEPRTRLEMELLDGEFGVLQRAGHGCLEVGPLGKRVETEHLEELPAVFVFAGVPVVERPDVGQARIPQSGRFAPKALRQHPVAARGVGLRSVCGERRRRRP